MKFLVITLLVLASFVMTSASEMSYSWVRPTGNITFVNYYNVTNLNLTNIYNITNINMSVNISEVVRNISALNSTVNDLRVDLEFNDSVLAQRIDSFSGGGNTSWNESYADDLYLKLDSSNSPLTTNDLTLDKINVSDENSNIKWGFNNGEMYIIGW